MEPATAPADDSLRRLRLFEETGLPNMLGWARVEQVMAVDLSRSPHCRRGWVQQRGEHRVLFADEIDVDYDGFWFAQWPPQMRVAKDAYENVALPVRYARAGRTIRDVPLAERPSDLVVEAIAALRDARSGTPGCLEDHRDWATVTLARAAWLRALGHDKLARALIARALIARPAEWSELQVRRDLAMALILLAHASLQQGMPRSQVRPILERAAAICDGDAGELAARELEMLGADPSVPLEASDPDSLLAWLAEDLVFPMLEYDPSRGRDARGWPPDRGARSPALELVTLGWSALPAIIERDHGDLLMRAGGPLATTASPVPHQTTASVRRSIVSFIALQKFASDETIREWWRVAKPIGEAEALYAVVDREDGWTWRRVERLLVLDGDTALVRLADVLPHAGADPRADIVGAIVEAALPYTGAPGVSPRRGATFERLLTRSARSLALAEVAWAVEGLRRLGRRAWIGPTVERATMALQSVTSTDDRETLQMLVATIARADAHRGAALLRAARHTASAGIEETVLYELCDADENEPTPDCGPPLRRMFDAFARADQ